MNETTNTPQQEPQAQCEPLQATEKGDAPHPKSKAAHPKADTPQPTPKATKQKPKKAKPTEESAKPKAETNRNKPQAAAEKPPSKAALRRREARPLTQRCQELLAQPAPEDLVDFAGIETLAQQLFRARKQPLEVYETVLLVQLRNALKGDTRSAAFLRDSAQEKTKEAPVAALAPGDQALLQKLAIRLEQQEK